MNDKLKGTLTSLGAAGAVESVIGITAASLTDPEQTANTTGKVTISSFDGMTTSVNSVDNSLFDSAKSDLGSDLTISSVLCAFVGAVTATPVYVVETKNDVEYDLMEKRANKIYDKYHKNHIPSSKRGKGVIIADTPETAVICNEMFNNTFVDEYHLVLNIESLLLAVSNILDTKELISEERKQLEKTKNLLIELKAAYTEKKIITLSTKDNETLLFILNSFKKHQENKKSNAKKLIKEKKENI